ncbi:MAG TPA: terminase TerL endonuclease subunit [Thermomicrobiaceae bacterium]|nr:terminase TerL endonuclease subunit [Thermomicrobiaceae bacterium]
MVASAPAASAVTAYADAVLSGEIAAGKLVKLACERHLRDLELGHKRGLSFDAEAAERAIAFFGFLRHSKGEWAGQPIELRPWQAFIVGSLFGWKRTDGSRRFRTAYVEVPRKNGKSTTAAGIALLLGFFDGEGGAEVYAAATKKDQARIVWDEAKRMVEKSPALKARIQPLAHSLSDQRTASKFLPLGRDADTMDGLNIHAAIVDELHAHPNREVVDVLETATGARRQPLIFYITTAGHGHESVCWEKRQYAVSILEETVEDDSVFGYIATIDAGDDWDSPESWAKANPNLGVSVKLEDLERKAKQAREIPSQQNAFRRLHLDEWTEQAERWIDMKRWDACDGDVDPVALAGQKCFVGVDLASTIDITAAIAVFGRPDGSYEALCRFWRPEDTIYEAERRDHVPYRQWAEAGYLHLTEGNAIDPGHIADDLAGWLAPYQVVEVPFDKWNASALAAKLEVEGLTMVAMPQGFQTYSEPCHRLEGLLLDGKLRHGGNPILRWMAAQVMVKHGPNEAIRPFKPNGSGIHDDGIVALLMGLARATVAQNQAETRSIYESRGLIAW